jgi:hypothetical protein
MFLRQPNRPEEIMQSPNPIQKSQPQPVPKANNTCDFPAGLISDYIKIVDQLRKNKK